MLNSPEAPAYFHGPRRRWETILRTDTRGVVHRSWRLTTPHIEDELLDAVVYLYSSRKAAEQGTKGGGSGFLVAYPSALPRTVWIYAVTNEHVARGGFPVIRVNTRPHGGVEIIERAADQWLSHQDADLAVTPIGTAPKDLTDFKYSAVPRDLFVTKDMFEGRGRFGPGSDCFMVGRFITHDGIQKNLPTARFGNLAQLPWEPIEDASGRMVEAFLVETRSQCGYSGSPVFVYRSVWPVMKPVLPCLDRRVTHVAVETFRPELLGIDFGHFPNRTVVLKKGTATPHPSLPDAEVEQNWGIMCVSPAWKLAELLENVDLKDLREREEREAHEIGVVPDVAEDKPAGDSDFTREDFLRSLGKIEKKPAAETAED